MIRTFGVAIPSLLGAHVVQQLITSVVLAFAVQYTTDVAADLVGFQFDGEFGNPLSVDIFEETVPAFAPFSGQVVYQTSTLPTHEDLECSDCSGYAQRLTGGFTLSIGPLELESDNFVVYVINNSPGIIPGEFDDVLLARYDDDTTPMLSSGIRVNGQEVVNAFLELSLTGNRFLFSDTDLPANPMAVDFPLSLLRLRDPRNEGFGLFGFLNLPSGLQRITFAIGDYDLDGSVSVDDYAIWKGSYGSSIDLSADGNGDGLVDATDYALWRDNLGSSTVALASNLPEAKSLTLTLIAVLCWFQLRGARAL